MTQQREGTSTARGVGHGCTLCRRRVGATQVRRIQCAGGWWCVQDELTAADMARGLEVKGGGQR